MLSTTLPQVALTSPVVVVPDARPPITAKVLHVVNGEHYAGAERVQDLLALTLPQYGFEAAFACVKPGNFAATRQSLASPLVELPMASRFDLTSIRRLAAIIREGQFSLVHTHTPRSLFIGRLAAGWAQVPIVHHLHSPTTSDTPYRLRNWLNAATERLCLTGVDAVVAVSESLARYARRTAITADKLRVVPNGVPVHGSLRPRSPPRDRWMLGCVALFRPRKGLDVLLKALAALRQARLPVRLRVIGSFETPQYERDIKSLATSLGVSGLIEWRGFSSHVSDELDTLDLFILPSLFGEGMPMVVLEAMAAGLPVIGTNVEGVPEVVRDGLEGLIVPPGNAQALAGAIERFITGEVNWTEMRRNGHRRQADRFSQQSMTAAVADIYRRVLSHPTAEA